jgi:signal transduction histidine kinase
MEGPTRFIFFIWVIGAGASHLTEAVGDGPHLISMRERIRLVEGSLSINANLQIGTQISVRIPLPAEASANRIRSAAR